MSGEGRSIRLLNRLVQKLAVDEGLHQFRSRSRVDPARPPGEGDGEGEVQITDEEHRLASKTLKDRPIAGALKLRWRHRHARDRRRAQ